MLANHFRFGPALAFLALLLLAGPPRALWAQNLLSNPHFDSNLAGWTVFGSVTWDGALDGGGTAFHGSAKADYDQPAATGFFGGIQQCVPLTIGTTYQLRGDIFLPAGNTATGGAFFILIPYPTVGCAGAPPPGPQVLTPEVTAVATWTSSSKTFTNSFAHSAQIGAYLAPTTGGHLQANFDNVAITPVPADTCVANDHTLCFLGSRFRVTATFDTGAGHPADAHAVPIGNSGYLWFFNDDNVEVVVKMLDGCGLGGHYWFFAGGLTNVAVVITVTDTETGAIRTYVNPSQTAFQPIQDTGAFPCF